MTNAPKKMSYPKSMTLARDVSRRAFLHTSAGAAGALLLSAPGWCQPDSRTKVCPKSAPLARRLAVMRLEELTSHSWDMRLTLTCLQGIVNRKQPRLCLIQDRYDELWLEWLKQRGDVDEAEWLDVGQVFGRFLPEVKSMFVTDPASSGNGLSFFLPSNSSFPLGDGKISLFGFHISYVGTATGPTTLITGTWAVTG